MKNKLEVLSDQEKVNKIKAVRKLISISSPLNYRRKGFAVQSLIHHLNEVSIGGAFTRLFNFYDHGRMVENHFKRQQN
jgi:hypothetical protein